MRGRLIFQFMAELARLDTNAIETAGDYDHTFREVIKVDTDNDGIGESQRKEYAHDMVPCQVEPQTWETLRAHDLGNNVEIDVALVFHFRDLERLSLVQSDGNPAIHVGDRLVAIWNRAGSVKVQDVRTPPGLYVTESNPIGYGLDVLAPSRNLLLVTFQQRGIED
jgi:hypothetical protein